MSKSTDGASAGGVKLLRQIVDERVSLPTIPTALHRVNELLLVDGVAPLDVARELSKDPALSSRLLRIVNSSSFALRCSAPSVEQAAAVLGLDALRSLVLQASVFDLYRTPGSVDFDVEGLWRHSCLTAALSPLLLAKARLPGASAVAPGVLHTCGLLHDIGMIVLLDGLGGEYAKLVHEAGRNGERLCAREDLVLGFNHTDVGALVACRWRLPDAVAKAIQSHHGRGLGMESPEALCVHFADKIAYTIAEGRRDRLRLLTPRATRALGIDARELGDVARQGLDAWSALGVDEPT